MNTETNDIRYQAFEMLCKKTVRALENHAFTAVYCATAQEATDYIYNIAQDAKSIGFGGSMTVKELGVEATLEAHGKEILNHSSPKVAVEDKHAMMQKQQTCDLFLSGVNALTTSGEIVNIDGVGNRVSASIFGPQKIILVASRNKIVDGDSADAIRRIKTLAAPPNTVRLNKATPCAQTGVCADCNSPDRICRVTVIMDRKPTRSDITVLVINDDMGF